MKYILYALTPLLLTACAATTKPAVQVEVLAKTTKSWNNQTLPAYPTGQPEVTVLRIVIPPDTTLPWHKHPVINAAVILKGKLTVVSKDGQTRHLNSGDALVELVNTWHYGINKSEQDVELIVFYAGTTDLPITVKKPD
ncbi:MAG: quercetin dioxygenase-like cupin family protein [Phenylobacterium sp.]|jgi:quercetin dioxygenase-like cupin family protein